MGWLRDRWLDAGYHSAEKLAAYMLRPGQWPLGVDRIGERSLGNNLRALDKGQRRGWWRRDAGLMDLLAAAIFCEPEEVERELFRRPSSGDGEPVVRAELAVLGHLRPLVLSREELPPGIPMLARQAARWDRVWWCSRDRVVPALVGRWLAARGVASFVAGRTWDEVRPRLPNNGRVFVTLELADGDMVELAAAPVLEGLQVLIAAPFPWERSTLCPVPGAFTWTPCPKATAARPWTDITCGPLERWLPALVEWALARVPKKKRPAVKDVLAVLRATGLPRYFEGPGDVLDFLGIMTATDKRKRPGAVGEGWARLRVNAELERHANAGSNNVALLADHADRIVVALLERLLVESRTVWTQGWTRKTWAAKLPREVVPEVDAKAARAVVAYSDGVTDDELERLRRALHPKPREVIDALRDAELLESCLDASRFRPQRSWAIEVLHASAFERRIDRGQALSIGELALQPHLAEPVIEALLDRVENEHFSLRLVERETSELSSPAVLAAAEACAVAIGLARLHENQEVPTAFVKAAWNLRAQLAVTTGTIFPAIPLVSPTQKGLASAGVFALALLSICEGAADRGLLHEAAVSLARTAKESIVDLAATARGRALVPGAARLAFRFISASNDPDLLEKFEDDALFAPVYLFDFALRWRQDPKACEAERDFIVLRHTGLSPSALLSGIDAVGDELDRSSDEVLMCMWEAWKELDVSAELPPLRWLDEDPASAERLWRAGSLASKEPFLCALVHRGEYPEVIARALDIDGWRGWIQSGFSVAKDFGYAEKHAKFWRAVPDDALRSFLEIDFTDREHHRVPLALGWQRLPETLVALVRTQPIQGAVKLLPDSASGHTDSLLAIVAGRSTEIQRSDWIARQATEWLQAVMARRESNLHKLHTLLRTLTRPGLL